MTKKLSHFLKYLTPLFLLALMVTGCLSMAPSDFIPYSAAKTGNLAEVRAYVEDGGGIDKRSEISGDNYTLLWKAAQFGQMEIVRYLVENGAYVNSLGRDRDGTSYVSPYVIALNNGHKDVADYLAKHGGTVRIK